MFTPRSAGITIYGARANKSAPATRHDRPQAGDETLFGLDSLHTLLQQALAPVRPAAAFRQALARDLVSLARQKQSPRIILQQPRRHRRGILIGAAVSSAVSVAGLVALLWHHRARQAVPHAPQIS